MESDLDYLCEMFPTWHREDLRLLYVEVGYSLDIVIDRISGGHAAQWTCKGQEKQRPREAAAVTPRRTPRFEVRSSTKPRPRDRELDTMKRPEIKHRGSKPNSSQVILRPMQGKQANVVAEKPVETIFAAGTITEEAPVPVKNATTVPEMIRTVEPIADTTSIEANADIVVIPSGYDKVPHSNNIEVPIVVFPSGFPQLSRVHDLPCVQLPLSTKSYDLPAEYEQMLQSRRSNLDYDDLDDLFPETARRKISGRYAQY